MESRRTDEYLTSCGLINQLNATRFKLDVKCKNEKQKQFLKNLKDLNYKLNICDAPAGVGKSLLALTAGLHHIKSGNVDKMIVIVPTVEASEATKSDYCQVQLKKNQAISDCDSVFRRKDT